ncbi:MAG: hypothetical protein EA398_07750, partial [Deltaproteobacteria bacterium]
MGILVTPHRQGAALRMGVLAALVLLLVACDYSLDPPPFESDGSGDDVSGSSSGPSGGPSGGLPSATVDDVSDGDVSDVSGSGTSGSEPDVSGSGVPEAVNACGGLAPSLSYEGGSGELLSPCGCGGVLVCNGTDALQCMGEEALNACGGCGALSGVPGESCGDCGGSWSCGDQGDVVCVGASRANGCGGCGALPGAPGRLCDGAESEAAWVCGG